MSDSNKCTAVTPAMTSNFVKKRAAVNQVGVLLAMTKS